MASLRERLAVVEEPKAENQTQLHRLLDSYLSSDFPRAMLTDRKAFLETAIRGLERERDALSNRLASGILTDEQVRTFEEFAAKIRKGLNGADQSFEARRRIIEMLDLTATLAVEESEKVA